MFERLLPRHLEIIYALNHFFLEDVRAHHLGDDERMPWPGGSRIGAYPQVLPAGTTCAG
jgi:hypothetical protein